MKNTLSEKSTLSERWCASIAAIAIWFASPVLAQQATAPDAEAAIRRAAQEFTEAFDRGDAEALASHFTIDGVYVNEDGERFAGRNAIKKEYEALFANFSDLKLKLEIDSVRIVSAATAVEEGRVALTPQPPGTNRVMSTYVAVHTLQDGKWLVADVRDTRVELPPDLGQLEDLGWLVGTWTAANESTRVEVKGRWIENNHFLARTHTVTAAEKVASTGLEIVGVDPSTGQITSWSFTSDGGHAIGLWAPHDNGWVVQMSGVTKDGTGTRASNQLTHKDDDTLLWSSTDRFAAEAPLPDIQTVTLKRQ